MDRRRYDADCSDPEPYFHFDVDPDPDPVWHEYDADSLPQVLQMLENMVKKSTFIHSNAS